MIAGSFQVSRLMLWLLVGVTSATLAIHGAGWVATASVLRQGVTFHAPQIQSAIVVGLALVVLRAAAAPRRSRRLIVICVLAVAAVAFVTVPLPRQFEGEGLMPGGADTAKSREAFETRFRVSDGEVNFHSHLGDVVMTMLDGAFGRSGTAPARAYDAISRLAGLLFLIELTLVASWHRWSRRSCRYVGLAMAAPVSLLYFGYWDLGYLSMAAGVFPLLALAGERMRARTDLATLVAGFLQGLHTALHGFGLIGMAGGALAGLAWRGDGVSRFVRAATFAAAAVSMYLGWIFFYVTIGRLSIIWERQIGYRPLVQSMVFDHRLAYPLFSQAGLGEFGLFGALAGVPLLLLAALSYRRAALIPAVLFALPGLMFLVRWWPISAPFNLDLLLSVFPGVFAANWVLASSRRTAGLGLFVLAGLHVLVWTTVGNGLFARLDG